MPDATLPSAQRILVRLDEETVVSLDAALGESIIKAINLEISYLLPYSAALNDWSERVAKTEEDRQFVLAQSGSIMAIAPANNAMFDAFVNVPAEIVDARWATKREREVFVSFDAAIRKRIADTEAQVRAETARLQSDIDRAGTTRSRLAAPLSGDAPPKPTSALPQPPVSIVPSQPLRRTYNFGPRCYLCGSQCGDEVFRRDVYTGSDQRLSFGRSVRFSHGRRQGLRTICGSCVVQVDRQRTGGSGLGFAIGAGILVILLLAFVSIGGTPRTAAVGTGSPWPTQPEPTPPAIPQPATRLVTTTQDANLRTAPSIEGAVLRVIPRGTDLTVGLTDRSWFPVLDSAGARVGYIHGSLILSRQP